MVAGVYLPDGTPRAAGLRRLAHTADTAMRTAPPASGRQLAAARGFVAATSDAELLRAWLAGEQLPDGVHVDDEFRWAVLARLSSLGVVAADEIDAELARDRSAPGQVHAAGCRAMLPTAEAKAAAWQTMLTDPGASNYEVYALAEGFWQPEQTELTAPYVERYFDEIAATARLRQGWVVARLALLAYPSTAVSQDTLDRSAALLARPDLDSGIRRSVVDAGDDLRRALASRTHFA
jgi:aminopeptidase N